MVGGTGPPFKNDHMLTRNELIALVIAIIAIGIVGVLLYIAGYNESFYSRDDRIRGAFEILTELGNDKLYFIVLGLLFFSYDMAFARRFCYVFFITVYATDLLKQAFHDPRPAVNELRDNPTSGFGFPSGHTTTATCFYGYPWLSHLAAERVRWLLSVVCPFAIVVVPVSRMVIGAHDLQDVVGATVIALSIIVAYMLLQPKVSAAFAELSTERRIVVGVVGALLLWVVGAIILALRHPDEGGVPFGELGMGSGLLLGCAIAFPLEEAYVGYKPGNLSRIGRIGAGVTGLLVTVVLYIGMEGLSEVLLPDYLADLVAYTFLMVVVGLLVPYLLKRMFPEADGRGDDPGG